MATATRASRVGRLVDLGHTRERRDQDVGHERGLWFDEAEADRVVEFLSMLYHHKGEWAGQRFELADWQRNDIIRPLFGWKRADGTRRFRYAYIEVPRKNGKSTLAAGLGLYLSVADGEYGAEVYSAATKKDQARIVWGDAEKMAKGSPYLKQFCRTFRNNINVPRTGSKFEPLGADSNTLDGLNPHGVIMDELHAHRDRRVWDVMTTAMGARRQPMTVSITTAGVYRPESIGWEQHQHAVQVLEGALEDDGFFAYIASAEPDDDWTDPKTWAKANPNLGISLKEDYLAEQCERAKRSPSFLNTFLRLHLNIWTSQMTRWLDMEDWNACGSESDPGALDGLACYGGLDLASTTDVAAFALVFPDVDGTYDVLARFWVPEDRIVERSNRDRVPYDAWARDGWITSTEGNVIDYDVIRADIKALAKRYNIVELGFDRWGAAQITTQLDSDGLVVVPVGQGFASMSAPSKELETLVMGRKLAHGGNPVLRWMASNVATEQDAAGNIKPSKSKSTERVDGIVALVMALDRATRHRDAAHVYSGEGLLVV